MAEVPKAKVSRFGPAPRSPAMAGVGKAKEAIEGLFEQLKQGELAAHPFDADGAYAVVQLVARSEPQVAEFEKEADERVTELRAKRAQEFLEGYLKEKCEKLFKDGRIKPNPELIRETDDKGNPKPVEYRPCMSF